LSNQKINCYAMDRKLKINWIRIFFHVLNMSLVNPFIYYKHFSHSNISALEYVSSIGTALIGNYCSTKRVGRPLAISNQKKKRIEKSISNTENFERSQLLTYMLKVISAYRQCVYCSIKERERRKKCNLLFLLC